MYNIKLIYFWGKGREGVNELFQVIIILVKSIKKLFIKIEATIVPLSLNVVCHRKVNGGYIPYPGLSWGVL